MFVQSRTCSKHLLLVSDDGGVCSFDEALFYGHELTLQVFEMLLFTVVDMIAYDYLLAATVTYAVDVVSDVRWLVTSSISTRANNNYSVYVTKSVLRPFC